MGEKRTGSSLPEPSRIIDRAAEAAGDAGDLGAELLSTGVDATTNVISRLTSSPEDFVKAPRRHGKQATGSAGAAKHTGATVKRAAEVAAKENRKMARAEASAGKRVVKDARKASSKAAGKAKRGSKKR